MSPTTMALFLLAAAFVNVLTYGGVTWVYFRSQRQPVRVTSGSGESRTIRMGSERESRHDYDEAA